ncbi:hypothetical protein [Rhodococcus opacus]|uniref:hypothetical protein n=1 Tax=Rhodococcus opacus TaxID=37919 RepID=UPI00130DFD04
MSAQSPQAAVTARTVFSRLSGMGPVRLPSASTSMVMVWPACGGGGGHGGGAFAVGCGPADPGGVLGTGGTDRIFGGVGREVGVLQQHCGHLVHGGPQRLGLLFEPSVRGGAERGGDGDQQQDHGRGEQTMVASMRSLRRIR